MAKMARNTMAALALVMTAAGVAQAAGADASNPKIVVHVQNQTDISTMALITAQVRAAGLFEAAGVSMEWVNDEREFKPISDDRVLHVRVVVIPDRAIANLTGSEPPARGTLGLALHQTNRVYLFGDRIRSQANCARVDLSIVLGRAFAHELGHILLPEAGHSDTGIMRARLRFDRFADPEFTPPQIDAMRALLAARAGERVLMAAF
jgi:hypothetical protein